MSDDRTTDPQQPDHTPRATPAGSHVPPPPAAPALDAPAPAPGPGTPSYDAPTSGPASSDAPSYDAPPTYPASSYGAPAYAPNAPAYGSQGYGAPGYGYATVRTNPLAIVSLVASLVGLFVIPVIGQIAGVITGHISLKQIKAIGERGRGMALAGLLIGYISVGLGILLFVGIFILLAATSAANGTRYGA